MDADAVVCPTCARLYPPSDRFCEQCAMPLVSVEGGELQGTERQQVARKIKPEYAEGPLVKVARGASQPEAEFIAGLLLEEGIPSMLRRSNGFDVPDFMAAGPRDVMVPESGAEAAREALKPEEPNTSS
jgi:hypothetical protein